MKKIFSLISSGIIWITILIVTLYIIASLFFPLQTSTLVGYRFYSILTDSMTPVISPGSLVLSKIVKNNTVLEPGDIITFKANRLGKVLTFTHFLKEIEVDETGHERYYTQGATAPKYDDYKTYRKDIEGLYVFHVPYVGRVVEYLRSPFGLAQIGVVSLLLLMQNLLGGYWDAQDRLILEVRQKKGLSLRKIDIQRKDGLIIICGRVRNHPKGGDSQEYHMTIELLGEKSTVIKSENQMLPVLTHGESFAWDIQSDTPKLVEDYRVTLEPVVKAGQIVES